MGDGRKALAPCGHYGETVIGTYVECKICDGVPAHVDPEQTQPMWAPRCPKCSSLDVEEFEDDLDAAFWYIGHAHVPSSHPMPPQADEWGCHGCGTVFARP